ncbi:MAG: PKD domain-containing protein, partial [Bacteroidota bacterium]|nr:PKD domain-containing protein [Bacteroidota bacterium]
LPLITGKNPVIICRGNDTTLTAKGGGTYLWDDGSTNSTRTVTPTTATTYHVTVTDIHGCINADSVSVSLNELPIANAGVDRTICKGDTISLMVTSSVPGVTYKWSNDSTSKIITVKPNSSQAYNVTVSDNIGCSGSSSVIVTVINTIPSIKTNRPVICLGQSDTIFAGGGDTYLWNYNNATTSNIIVSPTVTTTYTVTVGLFGCNSKDSLTITVNPLPPAGFAGSDQTICLNSITILSVTGTYSKYSWSTGEPIQTINPMPTTTTAYYVTVTDANGCSNTDEVNIFVNPLPVAFAGNDTGVCYGNSVPLLATGGNKYDWSPATGLSDITIANPVANPTTTTQYTVTVTDTITTCSATSNVTVVIYPLPIAFAGADDRICLGDSLQLLGTMGTSYVWSPSVGLSDSLISNPKASPAITTTYSLTVTDEHSCSASASMVLTVNSLPKAFAGNDTAVCIGSSITLAAANAGSFYSWSTGDVSQTTTITPNITATYTLVTTDTLYGCSASDNVVVVVNSLPDANAGANVKICNGASTVLNATGAGLNGIYSWSPDDSLSAVNISNPTAKPSKSTTYYVTVTDVNGCSASDSTIVYLPVSIIAGGNKSICYGDTIQLNGQGGVADYWSTTETSQNINVAPKVTTNFILMTTDSLGCTANDTINVFVNSLPLAFTKDTAICNGVITKIGTTGGISYNWSTNEITDSIYVAPTITSAYYVTVTDKNSCSNIDTLNVKVFINPDVKVSKDTAICYLTSTVISAIGGVSYHWYPASGLSDSLTASPVAKPVNTTTYQVFVTDANGCTGSNYTVVNINPLPFAFAGPDTNICHFSSAVLHATGGIKYHWNNGLDTSDIKVTPLDTTQYTVTVTDNNGCSAKDSITVNVINLPVVTVTKDTAICKGTQIELDANCKCYSNTDCARSFSWSDGTNKQYTIVTPMDTTKYIVVAADFYGCINKDSVTVFVKPLPAHNVIRKDSICIGANINLIATGGVSYLWNNKMTNDTINVAPLIDSTYIVTITNVYNCVTVDTNVVKVNPLPTVFIGNDTTVCAMTYLPLTATGGIIYKWNSGDVLATMHATIYQDTTFTVTVTNEFGCDASKSINIKSKPLPVVNATATAMTICHGTTDTLSTAAIGTYSWSTGDTTSKISVLPDSSKTYYIKVSLNGCDVLDSVNINVKPFAVPVITTIGNNTTAFCDSASVKVKLGLKSTYDNYQWGTGANTPTIDITIPGKYYVEVSDNNACAATSDTINVIVYPTIKPVIVSIRKTTFCERDYDMLTLNTKYYTYQWSSGSTTDSIRVIEKGNYNVTVTDFNNCVMAASPVNILVDPLPVPDFTFYDSLLYVQFYNLSNYGVSYTWDFRDGTTSNIANPTHIFPKQGAYQVMLIVHNGCGEDTIIKQVDVWNLTGIRNVEGISNVNVFPNPTKDNVTVRFVSINNQPLNIKMYNVIGDIVRSEELDNFTGEYTKIYDMSTLARGVYFLKINTERGVIVKKIVKD